MTDITDLEHSGKMVCDETPAERGARRSVAVVGAALRAPNHITGVDEYWSTLLDGADMVTGLARSSQGERSGEPGNWRPAGVLADLAGFDADFFGISAAEAERMDPQQRIALEVAWEAVEDAGIPLAELQGSRTGVYAGSYNHDYLMLAAETGDFDAYSHSGVTSCFIANRVSYHLDLRGPSMHVDTACSSSLVAVHLAEQAIRAGQCDRAIVIGVNVIASAQSTLMTEKVLPMAPSGRCRSFDSGADGIVRGEACGAVVLERVALAEARGRRVRALIRGSATNHDGRTDGITAPSTRAQRALLADAVADSGVRAEDVGYVEAHGTGTMLGDPIEFSALSAVYGAGEIPCAVGTVKANIGHTEAAAGVTGLIKAVLVVQEGLVPGQPHYENPNPLLKLGRNRLTIPTEVQRIAEVSERRFAAVNSLGAGGTNVHVILEAPPPVSAPAETKPVLDQSLLLPVSARDDRAATRLLEEYIRLLADGERPDELCAAAMYRRSQHQHRRAVVGTTAEELMDGLRAACGQHTAPSGAPVLVFGGQGAQWPGMGRALARISVCAEDLAESDRIVRELSGWSLMPHLLGETEPERIADTTVAQVCIAAVELAVAALLRSLGVRPVGVVGHSVGELPAAVVAGALEREAMFEILLARAALAEDLARGGGMISVDLPDDEVARLVAEFDDVSIGASNAPGSHVIAGGSGSIAGIADRLAERQVRHKRIPVEYGFHSPLLEGADSKLAEKVGVVPVGEPKIPFYSTVSGQRWTGALDAEYWGRNLRDRVRFAEAVSTASDGRPKLFVECSPHPVLLGSLHAILDSFAPNGPRPLAAMHRSASGDPGAADASASRTLAQLAAGLYEHGVEIDWASCFPAPTRHVPLPRYPWQHQRYWLDRSEIAAPGSTEQETSPEPHPEVCGLRDIADFLRRKVASATNMAVEEVTADSPVHTFGLESLAVVQIRNDVERELRISAPLTVLLSGETLNEIARSLHVTNHVTNNEKPHSSPGELLERVDELTETEIEAAIVALERETRL